MRLMLKAINDELAKRGHTARLAKASGYFYFEGGEAEEWLDRRGGLIRRYLAPQQEIRKSP